MCSLFTNSAITSEKSNSCQTALAINWINPQKSLHISQSPLRTVGAHQWVTNGTFQWNATSLTDYAVTGSAGAAGSGSRSHVPSLVTRLIVRREECLQNLRQGICQASDPTVCQDTIFLLYFHNSPSPVMTFYSSVQFPSLSDCQLKWLIFQSHLQALHIKDTSKDPQWRTTL